MKQVNGPGSIVSGLSVLCAAVCAECIPAMLGFVALAGGGVLWDMLRGELRERKENPSTADAVPLPLGKGGYKGRHMSGKFKSAWYKGRHEGIKKLPRRAGTQSRQNRYYIRYSIPQSERNVKGMVTPHPSAALTPSPQGEGLRGWSVPQSLANVKGYGGERG